MTTVVALANTTRAGGKALTDGVMVFVSNTGHGSCHVQLAGLPAKMAKLHIIDSAHGNPYGRWIELGSPSFPTPKQTADMLVAANPQPVSLKLDGGDLGLTLEPNSLQVVVT